MFLTRPLARKVAEPTVLFWVIKVLTTGMGETTSDFFVHGYNPYLVVVLGAAALGLSLAWQIGLPRYNVLVYWLTVSMVAVFGTMAAGILHIYLGVPYIYSATIYAVILAAVFTTWYGVERTLSVHSIQTRRRELFYWAAVLVSFAMGTAVGDMTAVSLHLGFLASGIAFTVVILVTPVARRLTGVNEIVAFWFAYILTRPLGASFADWLAVPATQGGLNLGKGAVSVGAWVLIAALVVVAQILRSSAPPATRHAGS